MTPSDQNEESRRLAGDITPWRRWGPYLSDRQWGTVREDYSTDGDAWAYLPHDLARSRAYRWGEDGIGGFADQQLHLCLSVAMWNGRDPILKERLFGLTNAEGNHGEDVKEQYYHLDGLPSHAYMRMLYKYPQAAFPYHDLVTENARRGLDVPEYELLDTGVFDSDRYFDVEIEYAKAGPDDIVLRITATNRGPVAAPLHLLPQLVARNNWSWKPDHPKPRFHAEGTAVVASGVTALPSMTLHCEGTPTLLFCDNETNPRRGDEPAEAGTGHYKDGINDWLVQGDLGAVNPDQVGTKVAALYRFEVAAGGQACVCVRLGPSIVAVPAASAANAGSGDSAADAHAVVAQRRAEADAFWASVQTGIESDERRRVHRQALAGMLWSKQLYLFDVREWLAGDALQPPPPAARRTGRDAEWGHLVSGDVMSMPDSWEYPWYAAWDLAFHCVTFALIDTAFAKAQLQLLTHSRLMHPNGQLPAYEWAFGDANPPVHAWAALQVYEMDKQRNGGVGDTVFLERVFHKLMINFTWWVNRKDAADRNIFQGGFLGLDNIGLFNRSEKLPDGGSLDQSDGTAWVATYSLNLMHIALELAKTQPVYEDLATKFFEHFLYIAEAVHAASGTCETGLWNDTDGFYYDVLHRPGKPDKALHVRSMVGLIPLFAVEVLPDELIHSQPAFRARLEWFLHHRPDLAGLVSHFTDTSETGCRLLSLMRRDRLKRVLERMLDEAEFLSPHGIRSLSKYHLAHPTVFDEQGTDFRVDYAPAEGNTRAFGGNSNWRGPVWMPVNYLIVQALHRYQSFYGDDFKVEYPTGSGTALTLREIADRLSERLIGLFTRGSDGRRPFLGLDGRQQNDPNFRDHLLFHEYFDGDNGRGCGASHQTGWTGLVALLLQPWDAMPRRSDVAAPLDDASAAAEVVGAAI